MSHLLVLLSFLFGSQAASSGPSLDFDIYKRDVQPALLLKRPERARCYACHSQGTAFRLQPLPEGATSWDDEASRKNFEAVQRYVVAGSPDKSRLLMLPLAASAGGAPFHPGGKHWDTQSDPEWQRIAAWVRGTSAP